MAASMLNPIQPIFYEDGTPALPGDYVHFHDYPKEVQGWLALSPTKLYGWIDDFNERHEGHPLVFVMESNPPMVFSNVNGMVRRANPAKDPPKGLIDSDGVLLFDVYMDQYRINKQGKIHGWKRGDGSSVGVFIPLPKHIARKFPTLHPKDPSPSHVTFLSIGEIKDQEDQKRAVEVIQNVARTWWPLIRAQLGEVSEFKNDGGAIPHMQVHFDRDMVNLRLRLIEALRGAGIECPKVHNKYKPHVTLSYLPEGSSYEGKTPKGSWKFDKFEVWGLPRVHRINFGDDCAYKVRKAFEVAQRW